MLSINEALTYFAMLLMQSSEVIHPLGTHSPARTQVVGDFFAGIYAFMVPNCSFPGVTLKTNMKEIIENDLPE